ncbi:hypothetical protein CDD80_6380 [Ophiocordyceps camponoti-rufipedis]|uniref:AAA+ ATPase domain-containing protein n=1 Tax=Ophiocordyceps camponoti-rufipedis TaxID=2004952 RepID=A0A2C5YQL4_9HYPO|nr:hypothetical protein CDD80_6380 [Ophiocordyceps camponoti-rufipedis]
MAWTVSSDTIRVTATSSRVFSPDTVTAKEGDLIEFHFQAHNHSVVSGVFDNPCTPTPQGSGFFSGYISVDGSGEAGHVFRITVDTQEPTPFYSSQSDDCPHGMVGIINPSGDKTLDKYRDRAKSLARAVSPPGLDSYGGDLHENSDPSAQRNPDGTARTVRAAAPGQAVPVAALAVAGGNDERRDTLSRQYDEIRAGFAAVCVVGIIESLEHLHNELRNYHRPPLVRPSLEQAQRRSSPWAISAFLGRSSTPSIAPIPAGLPRGLYLHGDVGSGKTMLMDLFYDTLPAAVQTKTRIHFHNFMQDVHRRLHRFKMEVGGGVDAVPFVAADVAEGAGVLCFDEFQCTDVADAMILRRLLEALMSHGVVLVTTSNRPPDELYKNGVQRESFLPAIALLKARLHVINLDSPTDYRKIPRPPSGVYHTPLDSHAESHADKWFRFLGDPDGFEPRPETQRVWGREIYVPRVSGRCARFTFAELIGEPKSAADYLELVRCYDAFIVTDVPGMTARERDLARRFITFIDAVYEGNAKLVLTTEKPLTELFVSRDELADSLREANAKAAASDAASSAATATMEDVDLSAEQLKTSKLFAGEEEAFAFARALSRLSQMESREWVERGMGLEGRGGKRDRDGWSKMRSRQMEDSM